MKGTVFMRLLENSTFPLTLQCTFSGMKGEDSFLQLLELLSSYGFYGVEVNVKDLSAISPDSLMKRIRSFGLHMTYLATGVYANTRGYSLSSASPDRRRESVAGCRENIQYAAECGCGVIIGFFKNTPAVDTVTPELYFEESLRELAPLARRLHVPILLEATNHYESRIANSLEQAADLAGRIDPSIITVLPDTYHMNIEESNPLGALAACGMNFPNIHFSDNNRFFPGFGFIPFEKYAAKLSDLHYEGTIGIEGNLKYSYEQDLEHTASYLANILCRASQRI